MRGLWGFLILLFCTQVQPHEYFGYTEEEQGEWKKKFPMCAGKKQSPISIMTNKVEWIFAQPVLFRNYGSVLPNVAIRNKGYTVSCSINRNVPVSGQPRPSIYSGELGSFEFEEVHFHWGPSNSAGSEHRIDNKKTCFEAHLVHKQRDRVLIVAILFKIGGENSDLRPIVDRLSEVQSVDSMVGFTGKFRLKSLFRGIETSEYYQYEGSETSPHCPEGVTWLIFTEIRTISASQLDAFRNLECLDKNGNVSHITQNYRRIQPINKRKIYLCIKQHRRSTARQNYLTASTIIFLIQIFQAILI